MVHLAVSSITFSDVEGIPGRPARKYTIEDMFRITKEMKVRGIEVTTSLLSQRMKETRELANVYGIPILRSQ